MRLARSTDKVLESDVSTRNEHAGRELLKVTRNTSVAKREKKKCEYDFSKEGECRWDWKEERTITTRSRLVFTVTHVIHWHCQWYAARPQAVEATGSCY